MWNPFKKKEPEIPKEPEPILTPREKMIKAQHESHAAYFARKKEVRHIINARRP